MKGPVAFASTAHGMCLACAAPIVQAVFNLNVTPAYITTRISPSVCPYRPLEPPKSIAYGLKAFPMKLPHSWLALVVWTCIRLCRSSLFDNHNKTEFGYSLSRRCLWSLREEHASFLFGSAQAVYPYMRPERDSIERM